MNGRHLKVTPMEQNPQAQEPGDKPITEKSMAELLDRLNLASTNPVNITECYEACVKLSKALNDLNSSELKLMMEKLDEESKSGDPILHVSINPNLMTRDKINSITNSLSEIMGETNYISLHIVEMTKYIHRISIAAAIVGAAFGINIIANVISLITKFL